MTPTELLAAVVALTPADHPLPQLEANAVVRVPAMSNSVVFPGGSFHIHLGRSTLCVVVDNGQSEEFGLGPDVVQTAWEWFSVAASSWAGEA